MRLDQLPRSENVEDLRSKCRLPGGFSIPGGGEGLPLLLSTGLCFVHFDQNKSGQRRANSKIQDKGAQEHCERLRCGHSRQFLLSLPGNTEEKSAD
jgi:hypothetical protein